MATINWSNFPKYPLGHAIINLSLPDKTHSTSSGGKNEDGHPPTPYQFTLYVMFALYCHLQGDVKVKNKKRAADYVRCSSSNPQERYVLLREVIESGRVINPFYFREALKKTSLRAIAYFSWEKERRSFLTRRVYPTYFDFLSYSHVPEGWGALGVMLSEVIENKFQRASHAYTVIPDVKTRKILIPYLREVERLQYNSILVLPVFRPTGHDISNLLGAFAFYVRGPDDLPEGSPQFKKCLKTFVGEMGKKLIKHEEHITRGSSPLARLLKRTYSDQIGDDAINAICELKVRLESHGDLEDLDKATASVMRSLSGTEFFSILDTDEVASHTRTIFVVSRDSLEWNILDDRICGVVGKALKGKKLISYDLSFRQRKRN